MKMNLSSSTGPFRKLQAMTLVEMMVAVGVGSMVLMSMAVIFATSSRSFAAIGNYVGMDRASRNALDQMSRDIRRSRDLISFSNTKLEFNYLGATNLVYNWNSSLQQLTQWKTGDAKTNVLLTNCAWLQFSMYKNIPLPGGTNATTTLPSEGKAISVAWKCSQKILSKTVTSEDMQQAMIVIRNKLVP